MSLIIGADLVPSDSNANFFIDGNIQYLLGEKLIHVLQESDYRVFNLEIPLTDESKPIRKFGPNLKASPSAINCYKKMNIDLLTLANNHIMDYGKKGLISTINILKKNNISYTGAGLNLKLAKKPIIADINGKKIGFFGCCEHEFSVATYTQPGANPFDELESYRAIEALKIKCDYIVVLYHGGKEHYRYPSPALQHNCRHFIEFGADLVVCQHSHCIGCEEKYQNGTIIYGQGNFLFDRSESEFWKTGILVKVNDKLEIEYLPIVKKDNTVRLADSKMTEAIMSKFYARTVEIKNDKCVESNYKKYSIENIDDYLWIISGANNSLILRTFNRLSGYKFYKKYLKMKYPLKSRLALLNYFECEAHREMIICGLKEHCDS